MCRVVESSLSRTSDVSTHGFSGPGGFGAEVVSGFQFWIPENERAWTSLRAFRPGDIIYTNLCTETVTICHGGSDFLEAKNQDFELWNFRGLKFFFWGGGFDEITMKFTKNRTDGILPNWWWWSFLSEVLCYKSLLHFKYNMQFGGPNIWVFPKIGVGPQNGWFIMENHIKMDDLGGKHPIFGNIHINSEELPQQNFRQNLGPKRLRFNEL